MKKSLILLIVFLFLVTNLSALSLTINNTELKKGGNFLAVLEGNILDEIEQSQIGFFKAHIEQPFDFDFKKIKDKYYIYSVLPYVSGNYSLKITDIYFKENNIALTEDIFVNFTISNELADFYVFPGALIATDNFTLSFYNNLNQDIQLQYTLGNSSKSVELQLQKSKSLLVKTDNIENTVLTNLELTSNLGHSYKLPVYIIKQFTNETIDEMNETEVNITVNGSDNIKFSLDEIAITVSKDEEVSYPIILSNKGNETAENITLTVSDSLKKYVLVSKEEIDSLKSGEETEINFIFDFPKTGIFEGNISVESQNSSDILHLEFLIEDDAPFVTSEPQEKTCSDLGYLKCDVCYGAIPVPASDGLCCPGTCQPQEPPPVKRNYVVIGAIVGALLLVLFFIFWKYKLHKPKARDFLKNRPRSSNTGLQTRDSLSRG